MAVVIDRPTFTETDRIITIQGNWEQFRLINEGCKDSAGVHIFYFDGAIEILMPGQAHEIFSHIIGQLLTFFLAYQGIIFVATGSADQEKAGLASAQPDQSYCIGKLKPIPDLSIEVVFTSGGLQKLKRYEAIGIPEVWFWEDGVLALYHLREQGYDRIQYSELAGLQDLDLEVFKKHIMMAETDMAESVRSFTTYVLQSLSS